MTDGAGGYEWVLELPFSQTYSFPYRTGKSDSKKKSKKKFLPFTLSNSAMNLAGSDFSSLEVHAIEYTIPGAYELITTNRFQTSPSKSQATYC
jgi:hypothetical protein